MVFGNNGGSGVNYYPNSFGGPLPGTRAWATTYPIEVTRAARFDRNAPGGDDYT